MRTIRPLFTIVFFFYPFLMAFSQDSSFVTVHYPAGLTADKVYVDYFDGKNSTRKTFDKCSDISFKRARYFRYADVIIYYPDTAHTRVWLVNTFWVGDRPADIYILPDSNGTTFELAQKHNSDSLEKFANSLFTRLSYKELDFLRHVRESYFQLWLFRTRLAGNHALPLDTLVNVFRSLFPDSIRKGPEGRYIESLIERRLGSKIGNTAPFYALHSTTGGLITSENTRGKYVLLDFWASWCGPCVEEMPRIAALHSMFDSSKLLVVSITLDAKKNDFQTAADRLHMTWPLIFGDLEVVRKYDVSNVPELFLLDTDGKIIYRLNETTEKGIIPYDDDQLTKLNHILSMRLGRH